MTLSILDCDGGLLNNGFAFDKKIPLKLGKFLQTKCVRMTKLSVLFCFCAVATAVKINPVSQVIGLLQDFHTK